MPTDTMRKFIFQTAREFTTAAISFDTIPNRQNYAQLRAKYLQLNLVSLPTSAQDKAERLYAVLNEFQHTGKDIDSLEVELRVTAFLSHINLILEDKA